MATTTEVLRYLIPTGGWVLTGDSWEGVEFIEATPITQAQFEAGFAQYDAWKAQQEADKAAARAALFARLGITAEEAALLLGGTN
jgi:hypothetical protein